MNVSLTPCSPNPCLNGGVCVLDYTKYIFACNCTSSYTVDWFFSSSFTNIFEIHRFYLSNPDDDNNINNFNNDKDFNKNNDKDFNNINNQQNYWLTKLDYSFNFCIDFCLQFNFKLNEINVLKLICMYWLIALVINLLISITKILKRYLK